MRLAFLLLLAANLAFFAWARYLAPPDPAMDRAPLARQLEPQKLRIVPERELAQLPSAAPAPEKPKPKPVAAPAPEATPVACVEWGSFSPADASRAAQRLEPLALGARLAQYLGEEIASWWVHMPPQGNRAGALKKAAELKQLGVFDYFIVQDNGALRWSLSLGVFRSEDAAKAHLEALRDKGVRSAVIGRRETRVPKVWFQVREVDAPLQARLEAAARDFEGATLHPCVARG
ncbi:MAG TPA: SPOR domain-containing protein [Burkholderiales bacterium]|nr:SPOR domain-containing protein [Burkholderiales bacterium]